MIVPLQVDERRREGDFHLCAASWLSTCPIFAVYSSLRVSRVVFPPISYKNSALPPPHHLSCILETFVYVVLTVHVFLSWQWYVRGKVQDGYTRSVQGVYFGQVLHRAAEILGDREEVARCESFTYRLRFMRCHYSNIFFCKTRKPLPQCHRDGYIYFTLYLLFQITSSCFYW